MNNPVKPFHPAFNSRARREKCFLRIKPGSNRPSNQVILAQIICRCRCRAADDTAFWMIVWPSNLNNIADETTCTMGEILNVN